jgi:hypothetical protein
MGTNRYRDAVMIQAGACNPSGIALAIVEGCREARDQGLDPSTDGAVRLMAHQLSFICRVGELDNLETYSSLMEECEKKGGLTEAQFALLAHLVLEGHAMAGTRREPPVAFVGCCFGRKARFPARSSILLGILRVGRTSPNQQEESV